MTKKQFDRLKPATRRILAARDILETLSLPERKRFRPVTQTYCRFNIEPYDDDGDMSKLAEPFEVGDTQLQRFLIPKYEKHCEACAMGALLLAHVRMVNHVTLDESGLSGLCEADPGDIESVLVEYFDQHMLRTIECAFEGRLLEVTTQMLVDQGYPGSPFSEKSYAAYGREWVKNFPDDEKRLRAIMRNIIANKGDFDITDLKSGTKKEKKVA